jgi:hypothetical protein
VEPAAHSRGPAGRDVQRLSNLCIALLLGLGPDQLLLVDEDGSSHGPKDFVL